MTMLDPDSINTALAIANQLPEGVRHSVVQTIARLLGSAGSIPAAILRRVAQGINDKTDARAQVWKRLAPAIAERVATDEELMDLATASVLGDGYRKLENEGAVALEALSDLSVNRERIEELSAAAPEDDWLNVFSSHAEDASNERLRQMGAVYWPVKYGNQDRFRLRHCAFWQS